MRVEMICTGEEVLAGQIVDTNAAWLANCLMEQGIEMQRRVTVGDRLDDLVAAFTECSTRADLVIVNGGLGPTSDDLSAAAMAKAQGAELEFYPSWRSSLTERFAREGRALTPSNLKQCWLPSGAELVDNPVGTACGFRVQLNGAWLFFTPGVPVEFKRMVDEQLLPFIDQTFGVVVPSRVHKLLCFGHRESALADRLEALALPDGITLGYRCSMPYIEIKLFARGEDAQQRLAEVTDAVKTLLDSACVAENEPSMAAAVHALLLQQGKTLSLAESCTGGLITSALIDFAGSSAYLQQGLVTYSNRAKIELLGVRPETLEREGAVSLATVEEMALGAAERYGCDYALATSGIAGPEGGSAEKPLGTVAIGLATPEGVYLQQIQLPDRSRNLVRSLSTAVALDMLRRALLGEAPIVDYPAFARSAMAERRRQ